MNRVQKKIHNCSFGNILVKISESSPKKGRKSFLIGTKFSKKAVERNKLRRQLREVFRKKSGEEAKNWDIKVMIKNNKKTFLNAEILKNDLGKTLEKVRGLFKKD